MQILQDTQCSWKDWQIWKQFTPTPYQTVFCVCVWGGGGGYKKNLGGIKISEKLDMYYSLKGG